MPPPPKSDTDEQARQEKIKEAEQLRKLERWQLPKGPDDKMWTRVDIPSTGPAYETTPEERERAWRAIIEDVKDMVEFDDSSEKRREPADDEAY